MGRWAAAAAPALILAALAGTRAAAGVLVLPPEFEAELAEIRQETENLRESGDDAMGAGRFFNQAESGVESVPDVSPYPVRGIDVSVYQGGVDWERVKGAGISFAYIKATEGATMTDERFAANWRGAARAGLPRGAYHFYNFCRSGAVQADHFIRIVPRDASALPPTIDLERSGACRRMPAKAEFRRNLAAFARKITAAYGREPVLYVNDGIYDAYLRGEGDPYRIWIADPHHASPRLSDWTFWQHSYHGRIAGIAVDVDLDVFNGSPQALAELR